jgi:hypothetical protein
MKTILIPTFLALLLGLPLCGADAPAAKEKAEVQQLHQFWVKNKGYLSEDWHTFKEGALLTLADLSKRIDGIATQTSPNTPSYFQLRLRALKEQRDYLAGKLGELNSATIKNRLSGPRYIFDKGVSALEEATAQAETEVVALAWINKIDKHDEH